MKEEKKKKIPKYSTQKNHDILVLISSQPGPQKKEGPRRLLFFSVIFCFPN
tara:strand:- start:80 stop:232 length:153 start_codon:yes stop_codon:yes gene_type:complete